jgi:uncharacterized Zn ribbon protein
LSSLPKCPACDSGLTYEDAGMYACPECIDCKVFGIGATKLKSEFVRKV